MRIRQGDAHRAKSPEGAASRHEPYVSSTWLANADAEHLRRPDLDAALLALDGERRRERRRAGRAAVSCLATALRTGRRQLGLELEEVALHGPAAETERDPVTQRLSPFLLDPVPLRLLAFHGSPSRRRRPPEPGFARREAQLGRCAGSEEGGGSWGNPGFPHVGSSWIQFRLATENDS